MNGQTQDETHTNIYTVHLYCVLEKSNSDLFSDHPLSSRQRQIF